MALNNDPANDWQRVSPVAVVYFFLKAIPRLIDFWPALIGILAAGESLRRYALIYGVPLLVFALLALATLQYLFFRFRVEADRIQLKTGVLHKTALTLDFDRVQQAEITKPFYFRPLGLATLGLESAGSQQQEVDIPGIGLEVAEQLRARILEQARPAGSGSDPADAAEGFKPAYQLRLPPAEVARYGLMHNGLLFLAPLAAPLGQYMGPALERSGHWLQTLPLVRHWEAAYNGDSMWLLLVVGLVSILLGVVLLFAVSMALALIYYWDYHLVRTDGRFQSTAGLGTQRTRGFRLPKLQKITIAQGLVSRSLKRYTLSISKAGSFGKASMGASQRFVVPVLTDQLLREMKNELSVPQAHWTRISRFYLVDTTAVMGSLMFLILGGFLLASSLSLWGCVLLAALSYPLVALIAWRRWSQFGYFLNAEWLALRQGLLGRKQQWLPAGKLQKLKLSEPPIVRALGLAHLYVWSTDGMLTIGYLPKAVAIQLRDQLLYRVVSHRKNWF